MKGDTTEHHANIAALINTFLDLAFSKHLLDELYLLIYAKM